MLIYDRLSVVQSPCKTSSQETEQVYSYNHSTGQVNKVSEKHPGAKLAFNCINTHKNEAINQEQQYLTDLEVCSATNRHVVHIQQLITLRLIKVSSLQPAMAYSCTAEKFNQHIACHNSQPGLLPAPSANQNKVHSSLLYHLLLSLSIPSTLEQYLLPFHVYVDVCRIKGLENLRV